MKERPIIFSGPMVRAILEGRKTQTRRVVKSQPPEIASNGDWYADLYNQGPQWCWWGKRGTDVQNKCLHHVGQKCPYGQPGDRLWLKEAWCQDGRDGTDAQGRDAVYYKADVPQGVWAGSWKSPMFMPRWASRITLELVNVRVERVQDISEADAMAEGCQSAFVDHLGNNRNPHGDCGEYNMIWNSINGEESWAANPWVWVLEFKRVDP